MTDFRPSRFQILPVIVKNLLIINGLVFLAQITIGGSTGYINMEDIFALHTIQSPLFKPWQLVTHMFMHGGVGHIFGNMLALWMFGSILENAWGPKRFLTFYMICGLGAAAAHLTVLYFELQPVAEYFNHLSFNEQQILMHNPGFKLNEATIGASGAVFGCLVAFGYLFPNTRIYVYFLVPLKAKWFVLLYAGMELFMAFQNSAGDDVAHVAHLGGALVGFIIVYFWNKKNRTHFY